jgi:hypothetical protein
MLSRRLSFAVVLLLGAAAGCASAPKYPVLGDWLVTSYSTPGSSVPPLERLTLVGISATLAEHDIRFGIDRCKDPTYTAHLLSAEEFTAQYTATPASLEIQGDPIQTYQLDCGEAWSGPPRVFIVKSPDALLVPWDGTFYTLVRRAQP